MPPKAAKAQIIYAFRETGASTRINWVLGTSDILAESAKQMQCEDGQAVSVWEEGNASRAFTQRAEQGKQQSSEFNPFERGPEITETR